MDISNITPTNFIEEFINEVSPYATTSTNIAFSEVVIENSINKFLI